MFVLECLHLWYGCWHFFTCLVTTYSDTFEYFEYLYLMQCFEYFKHFYLNLKNTFL